MKCENLCNDNGFLAEVDGVFEHTPGIRILNFEEYIIMFLKLEFQVI